MVTEQQDTQGLTRFRVCGHVPLVRIKNPAGKFEDFYHRGLLPEWACHDLEQVLRFMNVGLIEPCDDAGRPSDAGRHWECVSALISCDVPEDAGRPRAADMLRAEGLRYSNECISAAVALRKSGAKYEPPK
jgi:hypothetical protein